MSWNTLFTRQRARFASHRLDTSGDDTGSLPSPIAGTNESPSPPTNHADSLFGRNDRPAVDVERGVVSNAAATATVVHPTANPEDNHENDTPTSRNSRTAVAAGGGDDQGSSAESSESSQGDTFDMPVVFSRPRLSLADLEEERELSRRRSSACVMFFIFILFRLWMEAIQSGNFGLLMICLLGTSWLARWIRYNREQEDELDRRIAAHLAESPTLDRHDLRMLSFQAQLALAIMESQRQMMAAGGMIVTTLPVLPTRPKPSGKKSPSKRRGRRHHCRHPKPPRRKATDLFPLMTKPR